MDLTTFIIITIIIIIGIIISLFIEDRTYKIYYFLILGLGILTFLNFYITIIYYIKLRNDPGLPGPRGPKGEKGPTGSKGKCILTDKCGFTKQDVKNIIYDMAHQIFQIPSDCLSKPSLKTCPGGPQEVQKARPIHEQLQLLEQIALSGKYTQKELKQKLRNTLSKL